jgi:uncharacterized protein (TIGR00251 family)
MGADDARPPASGAELPVSVRGGAVRFAVRVQPRASRSEVAGLHGDALKIRLAAPPVDGAANDALVELLATLLKVPRRAVRIESGLASRSKLVEVDGVDVGDVRRLARPDPAR